MQLGLVQVQSNDDIEAAERKRVEQERGALQREQFESMLAGHIKKHWHRNKRAKDKIQDKMLAALRQRNGEYDPTTLAQIREQGGSEIFMGITATKCRAAYSWVRDIILPAEDKAWRLRPTPLPDLPPELQQMIQKKAQAEAEAEIQQIAQQVQQQLMQQAQQSGQQPDPRRVQQAIQQAVQAKQEEIADRLKSEVKQASRKRSKEAAQNMERLIEDQLAEGAWHEGIEEFVDDFVTFPAAFLKGPILRRRRKLQWARGMQPVHKYVIRPEFERVSPFDIYPSPDARTPNDGTLIEHIRYTRAQLYAMIGTPGFEERAIRGVLEDYGRGGLDQWLWSDQERRTLEDRDYSHLTDDDRIDALHYWGNAQGLMLLEWGVPPEMVDDPMREYEIEAILVGRHVIRVNINDDPLARRPYHKASYQNKPGSFWGTSIPELMADIQRMCNATARALANNMGISSGPQVVMKTDLLAEGSDVTEMHPWKLWQMKQGEMGGQSGGAPIDFFQPRSNAQELLGVYEKFEIKADDATNVPRYAYGNEKVGGAGTTASGLSMLMESASKGIKAAVAHVDLGVFRPAMEQLWLHNMMTSDDESIKGDTEVVARGASALIAKDAKQAKLVDFLQLTSNEFDMQALGRDGRAKLLREIARLMDMPDDLIPEDSEIEEQLSQQKQQPDPGMVEQQREAEEAKAELALKQAELEQEGQLKRQELEQDMAIAQMRYGHDRAGQAPGGLNGRPAHGFGLRTGGGPAPQGHGSQQPAPAVARRPGPAPGAGPRPGARPTY